jgi:hypothetical protein
MRPIDICRAAAKNMRDVGAVEPFAFHNVSLHPNHFFRRAKFYRHAQQFVVARAVEPGIIHFAQSVAGAKNQIQDISLIRRFGQPMRKRQFGFVPGTR